ncbi:1-phosphofructokinase [Ruminococcus sp. 5_1_39BFAA]|uniref:1-phosphofructokinase n=1 Tax=Ruminococcus sp. 5_1_39BFAA TaxID=457412 RepID=UPI003567F94B
MIVTVTMNPAIDKTVEITEMQHGGLNRIKTVEYDAGGKGINVSKTIRELGGTTVAVGFLGGNNGRTIANVLEEKEIKSDFVWVDGETRTNTKVFEENGTVTELNEPGPVITEEAVEKLMEKLESYAGENTMFVLAGSIPAGVSKDIYGEITRRVHEKGSMVLMDADGELFKRALEAGPDIIKPNRVELEEFAGMDYRASDEELLGIARKFMEKGIQTIAVSMGKSGAMIISGDYQVKCPALSVKAHSTVGAGDAMVAALAYSWDKGLDKEEMVKMCMAVSAGAVTTVGTKPPSREVVDTLKEQVVIETL